MFEIGGTYIANNIDDVDTHLYDFMAITINPRILLTQGSNYSFSFDLPISIRTKTKDDRATRFGLLLPAMGMFNYGAGSVSEPNKNAVGFTAGVVGAICINLPGYRLMKYLSTRNLFSRTAR